jgi:hypothetical protein
MALGGKGAIVSFVIVMLELGEIDGLVSLRLMSLLRKREIWILPSD